MKIRKNRTAGKMGFIGMMLGVLALCLLAPQEYAYAEPVTITVNPGESIQDAIDSLPAEGGIVELAIGIHTPTASIQIMNRDNITIKGTGASREDTEIKYGEPRPEFSTFFVVNSRNVIIENLYIYSTDTSSVSNNDGGAIDICPPLIDNITISNVRVEYLRAGVNTRNISGWEYPKDDEWNDNITIKDCLFMNCREGATWWSTRNSRIMGCEICNISGWPGINMNRLNSNHVFENNTIHHCSFAGLYSYSSCHGNIIRNNTLYRNRQGIYFYSSSTNTTIGDNIIRENAESGILLHGHVYSIKDIRVLNNMIHNNGEDGIKIDYHDSVKEDEYHINIESNTIFSNGRDGIRQDLPLYDTVIRNNIIANNSGYGINRLQSNIVNSYNDLWNNNSDAGNYNGCSAGMGDISVDPLFADATNEDFHLMSIAGRWTEGGWVYTDTENSPCIDAGDPANDCSKEPGPNGGRINMGAYGNTEYASKSSGDDITAPTITVHSPEGNGIDVGAAISVTFSEAMDKPSAQGAFSISPSVTGTFQWNGNKMVFTPNANLAYDTIYTVTISTDAKDSANNKLESPYSWAFTTKQEDVTPPEITLKKITVNGSVGDATVAEVDINGTTVIVTAGAYSHEVDVSSTDTITVIATNGKGQTVTRTIEIK